VAEPYEAVLRRRAEHGTVALAKDDADRISDLVAELRHWFEIRQARVDAVGDERMRNELLGQKMESERRIYAHFLALDETAGRG